MGGRKKLSKKDEPVRYLIYVWLRGAVCGLAF